MEDEIYFKCEVCGKNFPADPNTMLECSANFRALDPETGQITELDEETKKEIFEATKDDPEIGPFLKGAICICVECQDKLAEQAEGQASDDF
jgi:hypothetical protein